MVLATNYVIAGMVVTIDLKGYRKYCRKNGRGVVGTTGRGLVTEVRAEPQVCYVEFFDDNMMSNDHQARVPLSYITGIITQK